MRVEGRWTFPSEGLFHFDCLRWRYKNESNLVELFFFFSIFFEGALGGRQQYSTLSTLGFFFFSFFRSRPRSWRHACSCRRSHGSFVKPQCLRSCSSSFVFVSSPATAAASATAAVTATCLCVCLQPTPYHECDRQGLAHAYSSPVPFIKDGLLFHLKSAHYQLGPTPLVLLWKDASVARYLGVGSAQVCHGILSSTLL